MGESKQIMVASKYGIGEAKSISGHQTLQLMRRPYGVKGSVYVVTLPAFQRCLKDGFIALALLIARGDPFLSPSACPVGREQIINEYRFSNASMVNQFHSFSQTFRSQGR
ncbi:hypothetical protein L484_021649 [Morus notabilis]|uniref:Uncharacterized protein n=1 Tax=Morus notabilis TaxID=981085 RepID=W9S6L5_9ROSA|nr:hypothetical protein L484_021649 [Morus notabilis]